MSFLTATDLLCLLICGILALNGYRRGAINSLINFGGFIASFIIARLFSPILAEKLIQVPLFRNLVDKINIEEISQPLLASFQANPLIQESAGGLKEVILIVISQFISFGLIIILVSLIIGILQLLFRGIHRVPVIGGIDRFLGLGIGLIIGLGLCFLMVWFFNMIDLYNDQALNWLNYQNSYFYQKIVGVFLNNLF